MRNKIILSICALFLLMGFIASAEIPQREKRIYLVDVTASMKGDGVVDTPDIFDTVKGSLIETLQEIADTTIEIEIIPFTDKVHEGIRANISEREKLIDFINELDVKKGDTNIADAWSLGVSKIDTTKINYLFILTDGLHNFGPKKGVLYDRLSSWGDFAAEHYYFAFYVMLTKNAEEAEIRRIADETRNMWKIEGLNINASLLKTERNVRKNIASDKVIHLSFVTNNPNVDIEDTGIEFSLEDNPHYTLKKSSSNARPGDYAIKIEEKCDKNLIPLCDTLNLKITHNEEKYPFVFITPDIVTLEISNFGLRTYSTRMNRQRLEKNVNFGEVSFKEPLVWIFKKYGIFRKSLEYLPYSWTVPDTTAISSSIRLTPNKDAVRSGASVKLVLKDQNGRRLTQEDGFFCSCGEISDGVTLFNLYYKVIPARRDITYKGGIFAETVAVDAIDDHSINSDCEKIADWQMSQVIKPNIWAWLLWGLSLILIIALIVLIIRLSFKMLIPPFTRLAVLLERLWAAIIALFPPIRLSGKPNKSSLAVAKKQDIENNDEMDGINCIKEALNLEKKLYQSHSIVEKYDCLESLRLLIDSYYAEGRDGQHFWHKCESCNFTLSDYCRYDKCKSSLNSNTWDALEEARKPVLPKTNGVWNKDNDTFELSEENTYYSECKAKNFIRCRYDRHGSPDFDAVTHKNSIVEISDLYERYTIEQLDDRGKGKKSLQYVAQTERMAPKLSTEIREWWKLNRGDAEFILEDAFWEWRDALNLVPHEDTNCRTMRLVYRPAHKAFKHRGGISNAINIKKHFPEK